MNGFLRWLGQAICFVLLLVMVPLSVIGLWARVTVLDNEQYAKTVAPLAGEQSVQTAITAQIMATLDKLADPTSKDASLRDQLIRQKYTENRDKVEAAVKIVVGSPAFDAVWATINSESHRTIVKLLKGQKIDNVLEVNGIVFIDLSQIYAQVQTELQNNGVNTLDSISPNPDDLVLPIFKSEDLTKYRTVLKIFDRSTIVIAIATVVIALLFVWAAATIWRGIFWLAVVIAVTMATVFFGLDFARDATAGSIANEVNRAAAEDIFDEVTATLRNRAGIFALGATIVAVAMFVTSRFRAPSRSYR